MIITEFDFQQALVFLFLLITQSTENPVESSVYGSSESYSSPSRLPRIINGTKTVSGAYPFMVAFLVTSQSGHFLSCGSSLYDRNYVITAAHCVIDVEADEIALYFGKWNIEIAEPGGEVRGVNKITIHPGYDDVTLQNDLALLELKTTLNFTDKIQPICMPQSPVSAGEETFVLGWGDSRGTAEEHLLQHAVMPVVENCTQEGWIPADYMMEGMFCAGHEAGGIDACQGDSGGPLAREVGNHFELAGIVSWGIDCALPRKPSVFADVHYYLDWIYENAGEPDYGDPPTFKCSAGSIAPSMLLYLMSALWGFGYAVFSGDQHS